MSNEVVSMYKAFASAQAEFATVKQNAENPFFKSKYAELSAYVEMIRPILKKHGFGFSQSTKADEGGIGVKTTLFHESGELMESEWLTLHPDKNTPQGAGSAITYARRYSLTAFLGLVSEGEDDDGNAASGKGKKDTEKAKEEAPPMDGAFDKGAPVPEEETETVAFGSQDMVDPPDSKGEIETKDLKRIFAKLHGLGVSDTLAQREVVSEILGFNATLPSMNYLSVAQGDKVVTELMRREKAQR